uniref:Acid phosphatase n=1 Tax=Panagrolaimus davidi TaxID=227884 RepID=A0A914PIZ6_9BILA
MFFRHGQRSPTSFLIFPTDDPHFLDNYDAEPGELTIYGIRQEFELGLTLRKQYNSFLGDKYRSRESLILAGKDNRTIASALSVLAALYPPKEKQIWMEGFHWQPIPVHSEELLDDLSFGIFDNCPILSKQIYEMADFKSMLEPLKNKVELLSNLSGIKINNAKTFDKVIDSVKTRSLMPDLLPPPIWARNASFLKAIKKWGNLLHTKLIDLINDKVGGWHFDLIIGKMEEIVRNQTNKKFILYSGHDTNIMAISRFLNLTTIAQNELQTYATYLSVELHQERPNDYFIEFWLHPALNKTRQFIGILECPTPCSYNDFRKLRKRISTEEFHLFCKGIPKNLDDRCTIYASLAGGLVICVVILIAALLAAAWWCCHYRTKYNEIYVEDDDENTPFLR